jgi:hypothetical protein
MIRAAAKRCNSERTESSNEHVRAALRGRPALESMYVPGSDAFSSSIIPSWSTQNVKIL